MGENMLYSLDDIRKQQVSHRRVVLTTSNSINTGQFVPANIVPSPAYNSEVQNLPSGDSLFPS